MNKRKEILILGMALFSMFFGAGNLIIPTSLGVKVGTSWFTAGLGFALTGIGLPLLGVLAFTKCGSLDDFASKVSTKFNTIYLTTLILVIGPLFAIPRTGSTVYEMAVLPFLRNEVGAIPAIINAVIFFGITLFLVLNESTITDILGKYLTPIILVILLAITAIGLINPIGEAVVTKISGNQFTFGFMEGYQTMDALASVLFGIIIVRGLEAKGVKDSNEQKKYLTGAGLIAVIGLGVIYFSLMYLGSQISKLENLSTAQTALKIAELTLGAYGRAFFGLCVAAACLTTSVGLVALVSDWFSKLLNIDYKKLAIFTCIFSGALSVMGLDAILGLAVPVLVVLYPITIVLILLNMFGVKDRNVFRATSLIVLIVSIAEVLKVNLSFIPLSNIGFTWLIPAVIGIVLGTLITKITKK